MTKKKIIWIWDGIGYLQGVPAKNKTDAEWLLLTEKQREALKPHYTKLQPQPTKAVKLTAED